MREFSLGGEERTRADLFESRGYREVRHFYEMAIELTERGPTFRALEIETVRDGEHEAYYEALEEAFADHWEWHPRPFDEWFELRSTSPN